jgi:uncharacterized protein (DUF1015 family)
VAALYPFRALRPAPEAASQVASVPYDVVNTEEARALASNNPLSFLHVTRAEIDLPPETNPYDASVYAQAVRNFEDLKRAAPMVHEQNASLYFYRLRMGAHEQTGLAGCFSLEEYDDGRIKKHERTRKEKEDDRTRHLLELRAQTGIVFLTYRASAPVDAIAARVCATPPLYDFSAPDGVHHSVWRVDGHDAAALVQAFAALPALYIADGHHRAASAARARTTLAEQGSRSVDATRFVAVAFPDTQVQILPYHRVVKDLGTRRPDQLLTSLRQQVRIADGRPTPARRGEVSMFLAGRWYRLTLPAPNRAGSHGDTLDVSVLQQKVLAPVLGIGDISTDKRIDFVGGARGTGELERLVTSGRAAVAFSMFPVSVNDLLSIADAGGIMPPKSTWFEPKLRDGLLVHLI